MAADDDDDVGNGWSVGRSVGRLVSRSVGQSVVPRVVYWKWLGLDSARFFVVALRRTIALSFHHYHHYYYYYYNNFYTRSSSNRQQLHHQRCRLSREGGIEAGRFFSLRCLCMYVVYVRFLPSLMSHPSFSSALLLLLLLLLRRRRQSFG
ncbi:hypothetical protein BKA80DRAFT_42484 [Phyllosticta citrichinensis]